jgi:hypothetical protein
MIETITVLHNEPSAAERVAELVEQGWEVPSGVKQLPVTGEPFPEHTILTRSISTKKQG